MKIQERIEILVSIGKEFKDVLDNPDMHNFPGYDKICESNSWFTEEFVKFAISEWSENLNIDRILSWLSNYNISDNLSNKRLGIVMAGNIPLVGFHDLICGFLCGLKLKIKTSSKDKCLIEWIINRINIKLDDFHRIEIIENFLTDFDAVIATGSNNTNRYFDYYFSKYPKILRKNRNSVAILSGNETKEELENLADDIFIYFGLGCRNISKIYVPESYDFNLLAGAIHKYSYLKDHVKYGNNLEYQYANISMNKILHVNYENLYLIENKSFAAPISIVNFEYYRDIADVKNVLSQKPDELQCIVSNIKDINEALKFGTTQRPYLKDYADNTDTIEFILKI